MASALQVKYLDGLDARPIDRNADIARCRIGEKPEPFAVRQGRKGGVIQYFCLNFRQTTRGICHGGGIDSGRKPTEVFGGITRALAHLVGRQSSLNGQVNGPDIANDYFCIYEQVEALSHAP